MIDQYLFLRRYLTLKTDNSKYNHLYLICKSFVKNPFKYLIQVWMPILSVSNAGKIRVDKGCDNVRIKSILRELTNLCQGSTLTANPRLGYEDNVDPESDY